MDYRGVLFDLDGTLLDTIEDLADSMNAVLQAQGFPCHPVESYKYFVGQGVRHLVESALPSGHRAASMVDRCVIAMRSEYSRKWASRTLPYPGIPDLLRSLAARKIPLSVLSNKPDDLTRTMVRKFFPDTSFAAVFGERAGVPRKPDPAAAVEISRLLNVPAPSIVYLGDTGIDMRTAHAAGMFPVGALWGFRTADELLKAGASAVISDPQELLQFFPPG